ncbi:MAG: hypothetical protein IKZ47_06300 [Clostridia bacterium]|nr:hypothetical protein [Clostridia bacterium]
MFFIIIAAVAYIIGLCILFVKDENGWSLWNNYYRDNIEIMLFHMVSSALCGIILYRFVNDTTINRVNAFLYTNLFVFVFLFFLHVRLFANLGAPRLAMIIANTILCAVIVFGLFKIPYTKYTEKEDLNTSGSSSSASHTCYVCGKAAYSKYGSYYYCPEHYSMVKTVYEAQN